jgi:hypothetical protein
MNKKLAMLFSICLVLIIGCKNEAKPTINAEGQAVIWQKSQEKGFGKFNYLDLTETAAQELMTEKFKVKLPKLYESALPILETALQTQENSREEPIYSIVATGNTLVMNGTYSYKDKQDGKYYSYATIEMTYEFDREKKLAWLNTQDIMLFNYPEQGKVYLNDPTETFEKLAALTNVSDLDKKMTTFKKQMNKPAEERKGKKVKLENSLKQAEKEKEVARNLGMDFGDNGTLSVIRIFVKDYTEK